MPKILQEYLEKIYAGWLGKIIGIRHGAQIENWTYDKIKSVYGEITEYPVNYCDFAADDDSNGPIFFLRALETCDDPQNLQPQDVANALLNYAPYEHGFFWWGGYGVSTEHTAYLNLRHGIPAPRSGSAEQNGLTVAEQIGGQIFIDTWGLVAPNNPVLAARLAQAAASVTHDKNGVYGGVFIAVCVSLAFAEKDIKKIISSALAYIPSDCEYTRMVKAISKFYCDAPEDWRKCYEFIRNNFGYDKYSGICHIIPNAAIVVLSLLYGEGDFDKTINICNMCGWDTDCNVANAACITAVAVGLGGINYAKWRAPINDFLACSSVVGSLNIQDIPYGASYIANWAYKLAGEEPPPLWHTFLSDKIHSCHFEYPGSTHAMRVKGDTEAAFEAHISNSEEQACTGTRSLKLLARRIGAGESVKLYQKTYYTPSDFHDSRYDPSFSPLLYPGQMINGSVFMPEYGEENWVCLYAYDINSGETYSGEPVLCEKSKWYSLKFKLPALDGACISEAGFLITRCAAQSEKADLVAFFDDVFFDGSADYSIDFTKERIEQWQAPHREVSQFTALKGVFYLDKAWLHLSCSDFAELYTGRYDWRDYEMEVMISPQTGQSHFVNFRVQGAISSYAVGLCEGGLTLIKNSDKSNILAQTVFEWQQNEEYLIKICVQRNHITASCQGAGELSYVDEDKPYLYGSIGLAVRDGSHCAYKNIVVRPSPKNK